MKRSRGQAFGKQTEEEESIRLVRPKVKRPNEKCLVSYNATVGTIQNSTTIYTAEYPCTISGIRWSGNLSNLQTVGTSSAYVHWFLVVVRDGELDGFINTGHNVSAYSVPDNVLVFNNITCANRTVVGDYYYNFKGTSKAQRKLRKGDKLKIIARDMFIPDIAFLRMVMQFWCFS